MSEEAPYRRKSLRNPAINYRSGWWSVTIQVAKNKSIFGAIVGDKVVLNELGSAVEAYWRALPEKYPELEIFDFVVMPNHFHALLRIHFRPTNREHHLGFLMSRFKGGTSFIYGQRRRAGEVEDIGDQLWQRDYWDDLITSEAEFKGWQKYIRENPANWSSDRYGACTAYAMGDIGLLNGPRIAFVASQGFFASELRPRKIWRAAEAARSDRERPGGESADKGLGGAAGDQGHVGDGVQLSEGAATDQGHMGDGVQLSGSAAADGVQLSEGAAADQGHVGDGVQLSEGAALAAPKHAPQRVLISTFTSAQEREALRRALAKKKPLVAVFPAGVPREDEMLPALAAAIREGWALAISPQPPGSRLNKKIATWCNEFLIRNAEEIWAGDLSPNGMLTQMLRGLGRGANLSKGAASAAPQKNHS